MLVYRIRLAVMALIEVDLLELYPLFRYHIIPGLIASIPEFHVLISVSLMRQDAKLSLT